MGFLTPLRKPVCLEITAVIGFICLSVQARTPANVTTCPRIYRTNSTGELVPLYPAFCPRPGDPAHHTQCCRHSGYIPACCQERAVTVCARKHGKEPQKTHSCLVRNGCTGYRAYQQDPGAEYEVNQYCPGPEDPDSHTQCSELENEHCAGQGSHREYATRILYGLLLLLPGLVCALLMLARRTITSRKLKCIRVDKGQYCWTLRKANKSGSEPLNNQIALQNTSQLSDNQERINTVPLQRLQPAVVNYHREGGQLAGRGSIELAEGGCDCPQNTSEVPEGQGLLTGGGELAGNGATCEGSSITAEHGSETNSQRDLPYTDTSPAC